MKPKVKCQLPFVFKDILYRECTTVESEVPWCSTRVDQSLEYFPGYWGFCGPTCPVKTGILVY